MSEEIPSPGWDAIDEALRALYLGKDPQHFGPVIPYALGGPDPLQGISAYKRTDPDHWHFVTYGFTDLYEKDSPDPETSGYGFELTLRVSGKADEMHPPHWALNFLQNLGRYVFQTGNKFDIGHHMPTNGPIAAGVDTLIHAIAIGRDPELGEFVSKNGRARFLQVVGITMDELALIMEWDTNAFLNEMGNKDRLFVTNLDRLSLTEDPEIAPRLRARAEREGSSMGFSYSKDGRFIRGKPFTWEIGALYVNSLLRGLKGRILFARDFRIHGEKEQEVRLKPGDRDVFLQKGQVLELELTTALARKILDSLKPRSGEYTWPSLPGFVIRVVQTQIKDQEGKVVEVIG